MFINGGIVFINGVGPNKILITFDMLTDSQKTLQSLCFIFSIVQTVFITIFIFNPCLRKGSLCGEKCAALFGISSNIIAGLLMPIIIFVTIGATWESADIGKSFLKVWILTFLLINVLVFLISIWITLILWPRDPPPPLEDDEKEQLNSARNQV